jgi:threonine/homoserine efflux transporter RhtA
MGFIRNDFRKKRPSTKKNCYHRFNRNGVCYEFDQSNVELDWRGIVLGLLAATSFTTTMFTANRVATNISSAQRSLYMLLGGAVVVTGFAIATNSSF